MYNTLMKYTLAIESSTATPSAALLRGSELLTEADWDTSRGSAQRMLTEITRMLHSSSITLNDIDLFAIGLGPGNFTGLRTTLATIQAMALPARTDVIGISSAEAAAYQFAVDEKCRPPRRITVIGDARRRRLWFAQFSINHDIPQRTGDFELIAIDDFSAKVSSSDNIITPDWDSLSEELTAVVLPAGAILEKSAILPTAAAAARLARQRKERDLPGEPLQPIYMHPPVFVKPRFS
jgi:tRNA threonylcarbamoyladenosine biosynthesis protein TsaB